MAEFKVGDRVAAAYYCEDFYPKGSIGTVVEVFGDGEGYRVNFDAASDVRTSFDGSRVWYVTFLVPAPKVRIARANDPATSKGKRRVNKYEDAVLTWLASVPSGMTGREIAEAADTELNCITPRFAPLRRKGLIKDSGVKRDKQIVWVLA